MVEGGLAGINGITTIIAINGCSFTGFNAGSRRGVKGAGIAHVSRPGGEWGRAGGAVAQPNAYRGAVGIGCGR